MMKPHPHPRQLTGICTQSGHPQRPSHGNPSMHGMRHFDMTTSPSSDTEARALSGPAISPPSSVGNATPFQAAGAPGVRAVVTHGEHNEPEEEGLNAKKRRI